MTVRRASVTTLTASYKPLRLAHKSRCSQSHTWSNSSGCKRHTLIQKAHSYTHPHVLPSVLLTCWWQELRRIRWEVTGHQLFTGGCQKCVCVVLPSLLRQQHTTGSHTLIHAYTHIHITRSLPPGRKRNREVLRCCWGVMTGRTRTRTHARSQTRVRTHKGTHTASDFQYSRCQAATRAHKQAGDRESRRRWGLWG